MARIDAADYQLAVVRARAQVAQSQEALAREEAEAELARQDWQALGRGEPPPLAVREPQLAQARAVLRRIAQTVDMVKSHADDPLLAHQPRQQPVHIVERRVRVHPDQIVDVEEPPIVELLCSVAPRDQSIVLLGRQLDFDG